ncbi:hypothetical protein OG470_27510 [Micromonospora sp. NBC_00389]
MLTANSAPTVAAGGVQDGDRVRRQQQRQRRVAERDEEVRPGQAEERPVGEHLAVADPGARADHRHPAGHPTSEQRRDQEACRVEPGGDGEPRVAGQPDDQ